MTFFEPPDRYDYVALTLAAAITVLVALVFRRRLPAWTIAVAAFLPVPLVALVAKQWDFVGWHAFMHASPIYQIMDRGGFRPEEPLFAGGGLRYPWVEHWITAQAAQMTGVNPLVLILIAETVAYAVFMGSAAWLASTLTRDRATIALATLLSAFGISVFHFGFVTAVAQHAFPSLPFDPRLVPLHKFLSVTAAPFGYAAMLLAAAASVRLVSGIGSARRMLVVITGCTLVAAFIHPLSWLGILVYEGVAGIVLLAGRRRETLVRAGQLAFAVGIPSALALPYLRSVGESESSGGWMGITDSAEILGNKTFNLFFFLATFIVLAYLHRAELSRLVRERDRAVIALLLAIVILAAAYLVVRAPGRNEYKFLLDLAPAAAAIMALSLRESLERHRALSLALLFLLVTPGCRVLAFRLGFDVAEPVRIEGQYQRAVDPNADQLYQWVALHTPRDAVAIATDLRMPALGRRSLYIALDAPWRGLDGWGLPRRYLLQWHVRRSDAEMSRRQRLASAVLSPRWDMPADDVMTAIQADIPGRQILVHARAPDVAAKLDSTPGFSRQFLNSAGAIYEYTRPVPAP